MRAKINIYNHKKEVFIFKLGNKNHAGNFQIAI